MGKGGGGSQPTTSTAYQTNLPEYAKPYVMNMLGAAQNQLFTTTPGTTNADGTTTPGEITGFKPYTPYSTDPTKYFAGPSGLQQQVYGEAAGMGPSSAYGQAQGMAGMAGMGQFGTARQAQGLGAQGLGIGQMGLAGAMPAFSAGQQYAGQVTDPNAVGSYMSPYMQNVVDTQKAAAVREAQIAANAQNLASARSGTYGGARQALASAERERGLLSNLANIQAQGSQNAYNQAIQNMQYGANLGLQGISTGLQGIQAGQQGVSQGLAGLGAQQAGYAGAGAQAQNLANIANTQQQADLARMGFQQQTGAAQQQYQQNIINQAIQDYATAQQYPLMQLSAMSSLLRGLPLQSATTQQYQAAPSITSQIAGLGTAGVGAYGLGKATGIFKAGGKVKSYKYGGIASDEELKSMAAQLDAGQLQARLRDPQLTDDERQIFAEALKSKKPAGLTALASNFGNFAGGGIVAFQEGDLVDDEEDDSTTAVSYPNEDDDNDLVDSILAAGIPAGAYGSGRGLGVVGINPAAPTGTGIRADAKAPRDLDSSSFIDKIMARESGGRHYDKSGNILTSSKGAQGIMQVMPNTQRDPGYGVKPAKDKSPQELERVGRDYATALLSNYKDPTIAAIAYNWGPGNTDKWLAAGGDMDKLPAETKKYIRGIKAGGAIQHFDQGGVSRFGKWWEGLTSASPRLQEYEARNKAYNDLIGAYRSQPGLFETTTPEKLEEAEKRITDAAAAFKAPMKKYGLATTPEGGAVPYVPGTDDTYDPDLNKASRGIAMVDENAAKKELDARAELEASTKAEAEKANAPMSKIEQLLAAREAGIGKQKSIDANLALIMAGLGAAGGTSKNALENISKGAQLGLGTYMTGAKQRSAEENAILSGRLGLEKMRGLQDIRQQQMAQNLEAKIGTQIGAREKQLETLAFNNITKTGLMIDSAEGQAAIAKEIQRLKSQDPYLAKLYKQYNLPEINFSGASPTRSADDILKQFNIKRG